MSYYFKGKTGKGVQAAKTKYGVVEETNKLPETTVKLISVRALIRENESEKWR